MRFFGGKSTVELNDNKYQYQKKELKQKKTYGTFIELEEQN